MSESKFLRVFLFTVQLDTKGGIVSESAARTADNSGTHVPNLQAERAPGRIRLHPLDNEHNNSAA